MLHKVIKPFPCSWDGLALVDLSIGDEHDFGNMAGGLVAEGWIEPADNVVVTEAPAEEPVAEAAKIEPRTSSRRRG